MQWTSYYFTGCLTNTYDISIFPHIYSFRVFIKNTITEKILISNSKHCTTNNTISQNYSLDKFTNGKLVELTAYLF